MPLTRGQRRLRRIFRTGEICRLCLENGQGLHSVESWAAFTAHHYTGRRSPLPLCLSHAVMLRGEAEVNRTLTHKPTGRGTP